MKQVFHDRTELESAVKSMTPGDWVKVDGSEWMVFVGVGREHQAVKVLAKLPDSSVISVFDINEVGRVDFSEISSFEFEAPQGPAETPSLATLQAQAEANLLAQEQEATLAV